MEKLIRLIKWSLLTMLMAYALTLAPHVPYRLADGVMWAAHGITGGVKDAFASGGASR